MKVFISPNPFPNKILITDESTDFKPLLKKDFQLVFTTGKVTLEIFKQFYLKNSECFFVVENLEYFYKKTVQFRDLEFVEVKNQRKKDPLKTMKKKYIALEREFGIKKQKRGLEISFAPRIFDSIRCSLENALVYKCTTEGLCFSLYSSVKEGRNQLVELEQLGEIEDVHRTLKSLLFTGILIKKKSSLFINELLL